MKKHKLTLTLLSSIITILVGVFSLYTYFKSDNPKLEVTIYQDQLITQTHNIGNLKAIYTYNDSIEVHNLWQTKYIIRNIGKTTIIGQGNHSNLVENRIHFTFPDSVDILYCDITKNEIDANIENNSISFKQWKSNEMIEINALIESIKFPEFKINQRDIIDADVYYKHAFAQNDNEKLIDMLPKGSADVLKYIWLVYQIMFTILTITLLWKHMRGAIILLIRKMISTIFGNIGNMLPANMSVAIYCIIFCIIICIILSIPILWIF